MIYHVVAVAENGVIGKDNKLPWHFSSDLKFFKGLTTGHTVVMGRKTFDGIGKPLPGRENIVVSRSAHALVPGATFVTGVEEALKKAPKGDTFIIGGVEIFRQTAEAIDGVYLTRIHASFPGDAFYPGMPKGFREVSRTSLQQDPKIEVLLYRRLI